MSAADYVAMCQALVEHVKFFDPSPVGPPAGSPFDAAALAGVVRDRQALLPACYRDAYAAPLLIALPGLVGQLHQEFDRTTQLGLPSDAATADAASIADTLIGAVRDWGEAAYGAPLARFEAVISNLYRSFLGKQQRAAASLPLIELLPPLATFAPTPDRGPFTLSASQVQQFIGVPLGVVSLPGCYAQHPLLWPALAHETGGHDVIHADAGLLDQIATGIAVLDAVPPALRPVWAAWIDETASDVYGILNIGPAFALSVAAFFAAVAAVRAPSQAPPGSLRAVFRVSHGALIDGHPVDLLRLHVAIGAVDALVGLSPARRSDWLVRLGAVADAAAAGATTIDTYDADSRALIQRLPLAAMASAARAVGAYIATAKLDALGGHSIQDIETWDDADDITAERIAAVASSTSSSSSIVAMGDDAQLLAGATLALLAAPSAYPLITSRLAAALDDSFARDPIFGPAAVPAAPPEPAPAAPPAASLSPVP